MRDTKDNETTVHSQRSRTPFDQAKNFIADLPADTTRGWQFDALLLAGLVVFVLVLRPIIGLDFMLGYTVIANSILLWMLFATAFNLLLGYTGYLSFGHALFLGLGMYSIAITLSRFGTNLFFPAVIVGLVGSAAIAYLIGRLIVEKRSIYFAMLTIAFGEVAWYVANANPYGLTGGTDGISEGVLPPWIDSQLGQKYLLLGGGQYDFYWIIAAAFVLGVYFIFRIVRSPFGRSLIAIRENEELARSIGIDTERYKLHAFVLSAVFTTFAGFLFEIVRQGATLTALHWTTSGQVVMMSVLGGISSFVGPMIGAFIWQFSASYLTSFQTLVLPLKEFPLVTYEVASLLEYWRFLFGLAFVLVVLIRPEDGAWGIVKDGVRWAGSRVTSSDETDRQAPKNRETED